MKTKLFFMLCLIMGFAITQLSAQKPTEKYTFESYIGEPILCDGHVFMVVGWEYGKEVDIYYKDGELKKGMSQVRGELLNEDTGEVFEIHIKYKGDWIDGFVIEHYNLKGNMGNHYNASLVWDVLADWEYYFTKMICH